MNLPLLTDSNIIALKGETLMFDSEIYTNFYYLAFRHPTGVIEFEWPLSTDKLLWVMNNFLTVGFNSIPFDIPLVAYAAHGANQDQLYAATKRLIYEDVWASTLAKDCGFEIPHWNTVDIMPVCPLKGSLKLYAARRHAHRIQDLPFTPDRPLTDEEKEITKDYCKNSDLVATEGLWNDLQEQIKLREQLIVQYGITPRYTGEPDLRSKSDAQIAESVIGSELKRITGKWPKKPGPRLEPILYHAPDWVAFQTPQLQEVLKVVTTTPFPILANGKPGTPPEIERLIIPVGNSIYQMGKGGLHSTESTVTRVSDDKFTYKDFDVASMYPMIIINNNFMPKHLGENFLTVFKSIVNKRLEAKKAKNKVIADSLKIVANSTYGKLGDSYSILYSPDLMLQVTLTGQLSLLMLIEALELSGIEVVSANTDGILVKCPTGQNLPLIPLWDSLTGSVMEETVYDRIYQRDCNNYYAFKKNGEAKIKGSFGDPWNEADGLIKTFQKNPTASICSEAVVRKIKERTSPNETIRNCVDIRKFLVVRNVKGGGSYNGKYLGRVVRWYYSTNSVDCIRTESDSKVADSEGAMPCMILPDTFPLDIDYEKYEKETETILENIGYTKRLTLFDLIEG